MKRIVTSILILFVACTSCKKEEPLVESPDGTVIYTINGESSYEAYGYLNLNTQNSPATLGLSGQYYNDQGLARGVLTLRNLAPQIGVSAISGTDISSDDVPWVLFTVLADDGDVVEVAYLLDESAPESTLEIVSFDASTNTLIGSFDLYLNVEERNRDRYAPIRIQGTFILRNEEIGTFFGS